MTLPEVYRIVTALKETCEQGFAEASTGQKLTAERVTALSVRLENVDTRLSAVEDKLKDLEAMRNQDIRDWPARLMAGSQFVLYVIYIAYVMLHK